MAVTAIVGRDWPGEISELRLEFSPLSHAILEVVSLLFLVLAVIGIVEGWSWVRDRLAARRSRRAGEPVLDERYWMYGASEWERRSEPPTSEQPGEEDGATDIQEMRGRARS